MKQTIFLWITLLTLFLMPATNAQQLIDRIAAVVGNEIILESELQTLITQYGLQNRINPYQDPVLLQRLKKNMLQQMVDEKLLLIKAEEDTITADEERVDQILDQQISTFTQQIGSQEKLEEYYGKPVALIKKDFRKQVANRLIIEQLRGRRFQNISVSRREVESFFKQYQDSLPKQEETVDISHILLQIKPSEESTREALAKIRSIKKMLQDGQDFTELASKYSQDPSAKINKGDLGWTSRGDFVPEFEQAAYALKTGEISDIVQTQFGFHIIQLLDRQGEKIHTRHILIQLHPTADDEQRVVQRLNEIRQKILDGEATFEEMALKNSDDPNVQQDKGHLGDFAVNNFQVKQFGEAVKNLKIGEISAPFKTDFGYHILQLNGTKPARTLSLENDWQQIERFAIDFKSNKSFKEWLAQLRQEIPVEIKVQI